MLKSIVRGVLLVSLAACSRDPLPRSGACLDPRFDPLNCGRCGNACPVPVNAAATCTQGVCGRTACEPGYYDLGGPLFGCSVHCDSDGCADPNGLTTRIHPLPERGDALHAMASGSSYGSAVQTSRRYTNIGIIGELTAGAADAGLTSGNIRFKNMGGFSSALTR